MPTTKNERKTISAMSKSYGGAKRARSIFYARVNKARSGRAAGGKAGSRHWLKALGSSVAMAASSGGKGRRWRAAHPLRRRRR